MAAIIFFLNKILKFGKEVKKIKIGKTAKKEVKWVSEDQFKDMLCQAKKLRDKLIMMIFYDTGIRLNELINLRVHDMNFKLYKGYIKERKGGKSGYFDITK